MTFDHTRNINDLDTVIVICGPTASGKSALAVKLAQELFEQGFAPNGAEIVSADSMQIYRSLDIGTAKITAEESSGIKHHMIDICAPHEYYSVAQYKKDATEAIRDIHNRNKKAIVCGGTGQYLSALIEGIEFSETPVNVELRASLNKRADEQGLEDMLAELMLLDPETAFKLSISDRKRIIRAHEIITTIGKTPTQINKESKLKGPDFSFKAYCLSPDRELLYERINARTIEMLKNGWISEKGIYPNLDFPAGPAYYMMGFEIDMFTPIFVMSRITGWCAHIMEQRADNRIIRPLSAYIGNAEREVIPMEKR